MAEYSSFQTKVKQRLSALELEKSVWNIKFGLKLQT